MPRGIRTTESSLNAAQRREFADLYRSGAPRDVWRRRFPGVSPGVFAGVITRMRLHRGADPTRVRRLAADHPAAVKGRSVFPTQVRHVDRARLALMPGAHSAKLGGRVAKGAWRGMALYSLTLEERATCPRDCHNWLACYGSGMPWALRWRHGVALERQLAVELAGLQDRHPAGFVVRLHVLGDFYSTEYVDRWAQWLDRFPALRVFGYTAWSPETPIGTRLRDLADRRWDRFAVRLSRSTPWRQSAVTIWDAAAERSPDVILCPLQSGRTASCADCALCWSPAARDKTIAFLAHGTTTRGPAV
jgi:hypothetical protein